MQINEIIQTFSSDPFWEFKPVAPMDAELYEQFKSKVSPPEDLMAMLSLTNGFSLFTGDYYFFGIPQLMEFNFPENGFRPGILYIGTFQDLALVIDLEKSRTQEYLYVGPTCSTWPFACTGTITDFLNDVVTYRGDIPRWGTPWEGEDFAEEWPPRDS